MVSLIFDFRKFSISIIISLDKQKKHKYRVGYNSTIICLQ